MGDTAPTAVRRRRLAWSAAALAVSAALLCYLLRRFDLQRLVAMIRAARPDRLALAFLLYLLLNAARAVRFHVLLEQEALSLAALMPVVLLHNLLVRIVPFSLGEVSYVALLKHHHGVDVGQGVGTLLGARLFDLLLVLVGGGAALALSPVGAGSRNLTAIVVCLVPLTCAALLFSGPLLRVGAGLAGRSDRWRVLISDKARLIAACLDALRRPRLFAGVLLASLCVYGSSVAFNGVLLGTAGVQADLPSALGAISIAMLLGSVPVSIGGLGVVEGSWTVGLVLLARLETGRAVAVGFFLHGCQLLCALLSGGGGFLWLLLGRGRPSVDR